MIRNLLTGSLCALLCAAPLALTVVDCTSVDPQDAAHGEQERACLYPRDDADFEAHCKPTRADCAESQREHESCKRGNHSDD